MFIELQGRTGVLASSLSTGRDAQMRNLRNLSGFAGALLLALAIALVLLGASAVQAAGLV
ncbi:MAG TPA: hypothetical protein VJS40_04650 [Aestuariivirgaceae bacterium]|nr:hypothetical protein [Aestuariivirgaceae bacterium]